MKMEMFIKESLKIIKRMARGSLLLQLLNIKETLSMINKMVKEKKNGKMVQYLKESTKMGKKQDRESFILRMEVGTLSLFLFIYLL
jgi:hypothetical protein